MTNVNILIYQRTMEFSDANLKISHPLNIPALKKLSINQSSFFQFCGFASALLMVMSIKKRSQQGFSQKTTLQNCYQKRLLLF